jgi:hypothetical protein
MIEIYYASHIKNTLDAAACKFACNNDPLRGDFRVQFRPL